jgi:peptide/nickel transport system substrate-binding protein
VVIRKTGRSRVIRTRSALVAGVAILAMVLAACGSSGGSKSGGTKSSTTTLGAAPGGTLVAAAGQDATCADWINACASSFEGSYMLMYQTMPRVFDYAKQGGVWTEVPNVAMAGMPTVSTVNGKQTVTYTISDKAVWSDGQPITSEDFKYTADQINTDKNVYDPTGYDQIESVATPSPKVAIVTFKAPFASWTNLFSADYGIQPSHILEGKNRDKLMKNGYDWSGGPWIAKWQKGVSVTLTPNPNWYGQKPTIQKVIFKIIPDTAAQFQAFKAGEVLAIYPHPLPSAIAAVKGGVPGTKSVVNAETGTVEALWMNNAKFPLDSVPVRQAIGYSIDRDAIVKALFGDLGVTKAWQSLNPPISAKYADTTAWSGYTQQPDKVTSLMTGDGWKKNGSGVWAKNGKTASLTVVTTAGDKNRELIEQVLQKQLGENGFKLSIKNTSADDLFGHVLGSGNYQLSIYGQTATSINPGLCSILCTKNIPTAQNKQTGNNLSRISVPAADPLLAQVDTDSVETTRIAASKQADRLLAADQVSLPMDPLPDISMWSTRVSGPIADNPVLSMFWNMNEWSLAG